MFRALLAGAAITVATIAGAAHAGGPGYLTVELPGSSGFTEPRVSVDPKGTFWTESNAADGTAAVWGSKDGGKTWTQTASAPPDQQSPTTDVDIVTTPAGRIVETELDFGGVNFRTAYSNDGGATWVSSQGTKLADTDRPWLAADPGNANKVYLLFHNLFSGTATHNMFVQTSTDGGATFGPPVPVTLPGSQAWADLQCADSGGPSNIFVAPPGTPHAGRVYVAFNTRSSEPVGGAVPTSPTGGCGASLTGTFEINVVGATRIWLAYSDTPGDPTSWHQSMALDDDPTGQLVSFQLAPGAVDTAGNVYVAYDESPNPYPNYDGAPVKYVSAGPDLAAWSKPVTVAAGGGPGHVLPHVVAGDPGNLAIAYWTGRQEGQDIHWYTTISLVTKGLSARPSVTSTQVSPISADTGTASMLMGACNQDPGTSGVVNGLACNRSADVWGIALTPNCLVTIAWPVRTNADAALQATYETTQTSGAPLCKQKRH